MRELDISTWKEFRIGDLFDIHPTKAYKLTNARLFQNPGSTPVVVNSKFNNGIGGYCDLEPTEPGELITFSDTTSSDSIFCQDDPFIGYPHVQVLYPKGAWQDRWSLQSLRFFTVVFRAEASRSGFDFVNKFTRKLAADLFVKLPISDSGEPDWDCMESYMAEVNQEVQDRVAVVQSVESPHHEIDVSGWKEFSALDFFELVPTTTKFNKSQIEKSGQYPVYSTSNLNCGVAGYTDSATEKLVGDFYVAFGDHSRGFNLIKSDFAVTDNVKILRPLGISTDQAFFICVIWKKLIPNLGYARHWSLAKDTRIKLPATRSGEPDWEFIDEFVAEIRKASLV